MSRLVVLVALALLPACGAPPEAPAVDGGPVACVRESDCAEVGMTCDFDAGACRPCRFNDAGYCL